MHVFRYYLIVIHIGNVWIGFSQDLNYSSQDISVNTFIDGTLLTPTDKEQPALAILIAGSGPTDRDGNQNFLKNNALKKLAQNLSSNGIATFRYDKRIVKQIRNGNVSKTIMFDDFVTDASSVIEYFKNTKKYSKIIVIGHSQGSLVGMLAAKNRADGFISLAGAGQPIDQVIIEQIDKTAYIYTEDAKKAFNIMRTGKTTSDYPSQLGSIFDISIQPFMMSWMKYNPQEEIAVLDMPILIINGTKDLQVSTEEAQSLKNASPNAQLKLITNMNHVLFIIEGDDLENSKSYNESFRTLSPELLSEITNFINSIS
ncbi:alpha/beta hydrolase [Geojedonia litorea]|uniref:Alpha/beta hydrolase n=1 Tax=Geojedonia litorea TaxID=1268269 RepID=A0ABV9MYM4_9FLAO